jgi:hypothetical protein
MSRLGSRSGGAVGSHRSASLLAAAASHLSFSALLPIVVGERLGRGKKKHIDNYILIDTFLTIPRKYVIARTAHHTFIGL